MPLLRNGHATQDDAMKKEFFWMLQVARVAVQLQATIKFATSHAVVAWGRVSESALIFDNLAGNEVMANSVSSATTPLLGKVPIMPSQVRAGRCSFGLFAVAILVVGAVVRQRDTNFSGNNACLIIPPASSAASEYPWFPDTEAVFFLYAARRAWPCGRRVRCLRCRRGRRRG